MVDTTFIDKLASADPTPGGGGACAYCGALAAALGSMVGNLTVGKPKYAQVEERVKETLGELEALRVRLLELIDEDARAFAPLAAAYGMPRSTPEELAERDAALQSALVGATEAPLAIMNACVRVIELCDVMAHDGSRLAVSDAGVAAAFARAALMGASLNVYINVKSLADASAADAYRAQADALIAEYAAKAQATFDYVAQEVR